MLAAYPFIAHGALFSGRFLNKIDEYIQVIQCACCDRIGVARNMCQGFMCHKALATEEFVAILLCPGMLKNSKYQLNLLRCQRFCLLVNRV